MACHTGPRGEAPGSLGRQRGARRSLGWAFIGDSMGKARHGRANGLALAGWNNSSRPWHIGAVPGCLVPGPVVSSAGEMLLLIVRVR